MKEEEPIEEAAPEEEEEGAREILDSPEVPLSKPGDEERNALPSANDIGEEKGAGSIVDASTKVRSYPQHAKEVWAIASPIMLSEVFQNTLPLTDLAFVGNLGKEALGAAALATVWFSLWDATMLGFCTAIDTYLAQSYGAKELRLYGLWTGTSLGISAIGTCFMAGILATCGPLMKLFGQDPALAEAAGEFSYRLIPGLFPYIAFKVLVKYLQSQDIVLPGVGIGALANALNVLFNWILIYKLDMGLKGAPWATSLTRFFEFVLICAYIAYHLRNQHPKIVATRPRFARSMWQWAVLKPFLNIAVSGALSMTAEAWSFQVTSILAGLIGTLELDAHVVTMAIATFIFLSFPFAVGVAASIRVGQCIGEGRGVDAMRSTIIAGILAALLQLALIGFLMPAREWLGILFSSDADVASLVAELLPISCIFMFGDAVHAVNGGSLRGLGRQRWLLMLNILAFWILAIPSGSLLTFVGKAGVAGLWWGMVLGLYISATVGFIVLKYGVSWQGEAERAVKRLTRMSTTLVVPAEQISVIHQVDLHPSSSSIGDDSSHFSL